MPKTDIYRSEVFIEMSGNFLTDNIPAGLLDCETDEEVINFIGSHSWEPLERYDADDVYVLISDATDCMCSMLASKGVNIIDDMP